MKRIMALAVTVLMVLIFTACYANEATNGEAESSSAITEETTASTTTATLTTTEVTKAEPITEEITTVSAVTTNTMMTETSGSTTSSTKPTTTASVTKPPVTTTQKTVTTTKAITTTTVPATTLPAFDIDYWIQFAKDYAVSIGLKLDKGTMGTWDTPTTASPTSKYLERDIKSTIEWYKRSGYDSVWVWAEKHSDGKYNLYISRG